jgi:hypothetical protein
MNGLAHLWALLPAPAGVAVFAPACYLITAQVEW